MKNPPVRSEAELNRLVRINRWVLRLSRHWLVIALLFLFLYIGLSLTAPVLMKAGAEGPANLIYTIYSPLCHQFAFRSWFFFGDQLTYPREVAGSDLTPFEVYAARDPHFAGLDLYQWTADLQLQSRSFKGNEEMGYKTALCERDVAIYGMMALAGVAFIFVRKRLRPAPVWLYVLLGLGPIGLDGFSQLLSYPPFELWPVRETLPIYRLLTGMMFGLMNIWLAFPYLEMSMRDTADAVEAKLAQAEQRLSELRARSIG
ncbi:MAG TPA: DUF2085 domain-containing protein [Aggregatilinea sp.]|jgi:uncharacterized membrane protein|uniref:DUF2085 domain-containing protein n=1 Tax=Aggregatilinea sp. TaxID=2806333 RepID=UPI002CCC5441|nr:DUF2085 domain-containing protein [Aggregatilinea sp.]HML21056.1 DUF2085 domain-containing protein [Aggregatilinea sp.]